MVARSCTIAHYEPSFIESGYRLGRRTDSLLLHRGDDVRHVRGAGVLNATDNLRRPVGSDGRGELRDEQAHDWEDEE